MRTARLVMRVIIAGTLILGIGCSDRPGYNDSPIRVQVEKAVRLTGTESFSYSGTIEAAESAPLSFAVIGTVSRVLVSEGDFVRKGQLLAELNETTSRNAHEMAEASRQRAEDAYQRLKPMHDKGSLPEVKFVEVETGLQQAEAAAAIAQKNLDDCELYAPVAGFVGSRSIEPGMNILPGLTAITLLSIDSVHARVSISEKEIARIAKGQRASVTVGALGRKSVEGVVEEIGVQADPIAHTYKIKILLPNDDHSIRPGMICDVRIVVETEAAGIVLPNRAVQVDETGKTFVYVVDDIGRRATRQFVDCERLVNNGIEIRNGVSEGQFVITDGQQKLVDGCAVEIVN